MSQFHKGKLHNNQTTTELHSCTMKDFICVKDSHDIEMYTFSHKQAT